MILDLNDPEILINEGLELMHTQNMLSNCVVTGSEGIYYMNEN
jgi:hypothetical protein